MTTTTGKWNGKIWTGSEPIPSTSYALIAFAVRFGNTQGNERRHGGTLTLQDGNLVKALQWYASRRGDTWKILGKGIVLNGRLKPNADGESFSEHSVINEAIRKVVQHRVLEYNSLREEATLARQTRTLEPTAHSLREISPPGPWESLTGVEQEAAVLVVEELTDAVIAAKMGITEQEVAHHLSEVLRKLEVTSRDGLGEKLTEIATLSEVQWSPDEVPSAEPPAKTEPQSTTASVLAGMKIIRNAFLRGYSVVTTVTESSEGGLEKAVIVIEKKK